MKVNINDLTLGQVKELTALFPQPQMIQPILDENPYRILVGKNCIVRTITMIYTGRLEKVTPTDLVLVDCSWIPCTERYMQFVADGAVKECEPYPDGLPVFISRGSLLDMCELRKQLPRSQK